MDTGCLSLYHAIPCFNPFPNNKAFAENNIEFDKNGIKFSKKVENTRWKRRICSYKQFLLFPHCFQKTCTADT